MSNKTDTCPNCVQIVSCPLEQGNGHKLHPYKFLLDKSHKNKIEHLLTKCL